MTNGSMTVHVVLPPRRASQGACWWAECTCGRTAYALDPDDVRAQFGECRQPAQPPAPTREEA